MSELVVSGTVVGTLLEGSEKAWYCRTEEGEDIWAYGEDISEVLDYFERCGWLKSWFVHIERDEDYDGPSHWKTDSAMRRIDPNNHYVPVTTRRKCF